MLTLFTADAEPHLPAFLEKQATKVMVLAPTDALAQIQAARPGSTFPMARLADAAEAKGRLAIVVDPAGEEKRLASLRAAYPGQRFAGLAGEVLPALVARAGHELFSEAPLPDLPRRAVILCATPRSGSSLVADVLSDMGLGACREHLRGGVIEALASDYRFDRAAAFAHFLRLAQVGGQVSTKLITHFIEDYLRRVGDLDSLRRAFAGIEVVWLTLDRRDKIRQAVSGEVASRRGVWHVTDARSETALREASQTMTLDFNSILTRHLFYRQQTAILDFLATHGRIRLALTYEEDVEAGDIPRLASRLATALLMTEPQGDYARARARKKLADAASEDLVARFGTALEHLFHGKP